jgi:hypothetical protein
MDAAAQVEAKLQRLVPEPLRRRQAVPVGENRVHAKGKKDDENAEDGQDFPADVLHDD